MNKSSRRVLRGRTADSWRKGPIAPNMIARQLDAEAPNRAWVTDVTCIPGVEGWLYPASFPLGRQPVLDDSDKLASRHTNVTHSP
ncbi:hypothetical protein [Sorangium sp. So ce1078]|uniref:hypothetical protein n=1 Tax=Sorangium sp. So ce1078 TaxID=3133329 RepID=UPI003F5F3379